MRHARTEDLDHVAALVAALRATDALTEKSPGCFYRRSKAFLHFHADESGIYADVRADPAQDFARVRVTTTVEQQRLLRTVRAALRASSSS